MVLALASAALAEPVWHSYDAVIRTVGDVLIRGDILDANTSINAELKFYTSADVLGVAESAVVPVGGNGLHRNTTVDAFTADGLTLDTDNWWALPSGIDALASDLSADSWFVPFVGMDDVLRPTDASEGTPPGGVTGVSDLAFHPPSSYNANSDLENHLVVIAFIAPQDGEYEISNFGARAIQVQTEPPDLAQQSVYIIDDRTGLVVKDSVVAGGIIGGGRDLTWKLSGNTTTMQLLAGEEIHFAVHSTAMFEPNPAGEEFYWDATNVAFDITLVTGVQPGDANGDGRVDIADYDSLLSQFGGPGGVEDADFNGDGIVDIEDFQMLRDEYGSGVTSPEDDFGVTTTPEPATLSLLLIGGLAVLRRKRSYEEKRGQEPFFVVLV